MCHIKTLGKALILPCVTESSRQSSDLSSDFAVCQQLGTRKKNHFAVCFFVALGENSICRVLNFCREFFCLALGIYCVCRVPVMLLTAKSQAHGKLRVSRSASHGGAKFMDLQQIFNFHLPPSPRKEKVPSYVNSSL